MRTDGDWWYDLPLWGKLLTLPLLLFFIVFLGFVVLPVLFVWEGLKRLYGEVL